MYLVLRVNKRNFSSTMAQNRKNPSVGYNSSSCSELTFMQACGDYLSGCLNLLYFSSVHSKAKRSSLRLNIHVFNEYKNKQTNNYNILPVITQTFTEAARNQHL